MVRRNVGDASGGGMDPCAKRSKLLVFGMPREAINMGGVCEVVDLAR